MKPKRVLLTVAEAAEMLGIGKTKMYDLVMRGEVHSIRVGRLRRIPVRAIAKYVGDLDFEQSPEHYLRVVEGE